MAVRRSIPYYEGVFFITITCTRWIPLFEIANAYDVVYKWFDVLKNQGHYITGYVIMPNHLHALLAFRNTQGVSINKIVGNGKRFMAYEIIDRLESLKRNDLLGRMASYVKKIDKKRNKLHEVFESSFDWKLCTSEKMLLQKLDYIHKNPCSGKWQLAEQLWEYPHSSAKYYMTDEQGFYPLTNYGELRDIDLTIALISEPICEVNLRVPETGDSDGLGPREMRL